MIFKTTKTLNSIRDYLQPDTNPKRNTEEHHGLMQIKTISVLNKHERGHDSRKVNCKKHPKFNV